MDLSNIFIGNKVVQRAYYRDALLYKSNGWQTLPSTFQKLFTKNYNMGIFRAATTDLDNNLYIATSGGCISKLDPDGNIIWQKSYISDWTDVDLKISNNKIFCIFVLANGTTVGQLQCLVIDVNGKQIANYEFEKIFNCRVDMRNATFDDENIYISISLSEPKKKYILKMDYNGNIVSKKELNNLESLPIISTNNGPYLYAGFYEKDGDDKRKIIRYSKNNFDNNVVFNYKIGAGGSPIQISIDNNDDFIVAVDATVMKAEGESGKELWIANGYAFSLAIDSQNNIYSFSSTTNTTSKKDFFLKKISSDGTKIWQIDNEFPVLDSYKDVVMPLPAKVIVDKHDNIYCIYTNTAGNLEIKKFINLVKEQ